jgi:DNA-binding transcriptional LysR family regulator
VAAELSFSRAAQQIHVVQSALSAAVAKLEKELGVALFDRSKRQIVLTAAGEVFLDHAREAIHAARRAQSSVEDYRAQLTGTVTLGILMSWGALNLPAALQQFRRDNPLVTIHLRQSPIGSAGHLAAIADGRTDLALVSIQSSPSPLVALRELTREPMVLVCVTRWRHARACNSPNSTHKISSSSRSGGEYANASTPVSPPPEFIRSMRTRLPTMRSSPNSSDTDSRRRSCPSAPQTGFRTYIKFLCVHR